jgi:dienelactone hydrolase
LLTHLNNSDIAVIVLHEIYGINRHILSVFNQYGNLGYDVYCPDLIHRAFPFDYCQQEEAYQHFKTNIGFDVCSEIEGLLKKLRETHRVIILIGFSIGATIAWRCSESGLCDGIIGYYGSRIRDYLTITPKCRTLLIFAEQEVSFSPRELDFTSEQKEHVSMTILNGRHGFCDMYSDHFDPVSAVEAQRLTDAFIEAIL